VHEFWWWLCRAAVRYERINQSLRIDHSLLLPQHRMRLPCE
jgi:hypothetical protein